VISAIVVNVCHFCVTLQCQSYFEGPCSSFSGGTTSQNFT